MRLLIIEYAQLYVKHKVKTGQYITKCSLSNRPITVAGLYYNVTTK